MKALLRCDDVFDRLTRGPFPSGLGDDQEVELHLRACHSCRQLAEALRPAVELLHESLTDEEATLPAYLGRVEEAIASRPVGQEFRSRWMARSEQSIAQTAIGCLAGIVVALATWMSQLPSGSSADGPATSVAVVTAPSGPNATSVEKERPNHVLLGSLGLPLSCYPQPSRRDSKSLVATALSTASDPEDWVALCCTRCHYDGNRQVQSPRAVGNLTTACAACHAPTRARDAGLIGVLWRWPSRHTV